MVRNWHFHRAFAFGAVRVMLTGADRYTKSFSWYLFRDALSSFRIVFLFFLDLLPSLLTRVLVCWLAYVQPRGIHCVRHCMAKSLALQCAIYLSAG